MSSQPPRRQPNPSPNVPKSPLRWQGVVFAFAANLMLVTIADAVAGDSGSTTLPTVFAPLIAGLATTLYVKQRGGLHALIGAVISLPVIVVLVFPTTWPLAIFASLFCVLGATLTELGLRRPTR